MGKKGGEHRAMKKKLTKKEIKAQNHLKLMQNKKHHNEAEIVVLQGQVDTNKKAA